MFEWLDRIPSVEKFYGVGQDAFVVISHSFVPDDDLRELIALVTRYSADASQLKQFLKAHNRQWFYDDEAAYWRKSVFGK